ncbi:MULTISPECIES: hypothetical protein [unclassified Anabaena]|uniref:hypothetical protein n=1 Tax=unclassified Anabaena TaxID=2619674 RepID=UPI00082A85E4|nr:MULTISPECIES: hypothetical protein [unclassified Anabaena]
MLQRLNNNSTLITDIPNPGNIESLAQQWAKKYMQNLQIDIVEEDSQTLTLSDLVSPFGRQKTAHKILDSLRSASAKAWNKTEALLSVEVARHNIHPDHINPWEIAGDSFKIYQKVLQVYTQQGITRPLSLVVQLAQEGSQLNEKALEVYTQQIAPSQLTTIIGADIGAMRKKYVSSDPRVIGFVSMQFHYTSQMLLEQLDTLERSLVRAYFKVIDDHLYMPLQRAYEAAAEHDYNSTVLLAVQNLLPVSTQIAQRVCQRVIEMYPNYGSMSGKLSDPEVRISSIRDVEMFQVYLWVSALEGNISAIQQELFPLCVMLYPRLKVHWELIRQMLHLLGKEIQARLTSEQANSFMPYFQVLPQMFSPEVFG